MSHDRPLDSWATILYFWTHEKSLFSSHDSEDISCMRKGSLGKQHLFLGACGFQVGMKHLSLNHLNHRWRQPCHYAAIGWDTDLLGDDQRVFIDSHTWHASHGM